MYCTSTVQYVHVSFLFEYYNILTHFNSGSARNLNLARSSAKIMVTVPGAAAAAANARRTERNLNNIDLNDISRKLMFWFAFFFALALPFI